MPVFFVPGWFLVFGLAVCLLLAIVETGSGPPPPPVRRRRRTGPVVRVCYWLAAIYVVGLFILGMIVGNR